MKRLLIINKVQFGYHTDIYKWCEHLRDKYEVSEITLDQGQPKCFLDGVRVSYVPSTGSRLFRAARYILTVLFHLLFFKGIILVCYFPGCEIFKKLLPWKKMVLDIRTLDVSKDDEVRAREDEKIKKACSCYDYVTIISEGLRKKIGVSEDKSSILPLGADIVHTAVKQYNNPINLLYVGTLTNRNIDITIKGFASAYKELSRNVEIHYDIIGDGFDGELDKYRQLVKDLGMGNVITLHGYIQHEKLHEFYEKCNVGVSYVPMTEYYEFQPVTKSFEYILAGLYTIATSTVANKEIINNENGVLIDDSEESFKNAIFKICADGSLFNYDLIKNSLLDYEWKSLVNNQMCNILIKIEEKFKGSL